MKILFVLENFYPKIGGVETLFLQLATALIEKGHSVTVFTSGAKNVAASENYQGIDIVRTSYSNRYLFTFFSFIKCIRLSKSVDIIHTTSFNAAVPAYLAAKVNRKKVLITFHEAWSKLWFTLPQMSKFAKWAHYLFEKWILTFKFDPFVAVSHFTESALLEAGVEPSRIKMIYNGLDYEEYSSLDVNQKNHDYLFYGRVGISKGVDLIMEAVYILKNLDRPVRVRLIVSDDKLTRKYLNQQIEKYGIEDCIHLENQVSFDVLKQKIQEAKAIVIPSYSEGFCYVAAESVALGANIISSGRGALKEVVSGHHIEMESQSGKSLADAFIKAEKGDWAFSQAKIFKLEETINQYLEVYRNLLSE